MRDTCDLTGITQGYISQIENDLYVPSARTLALLARAYETDEVEMLQLAGILDPERRLPKLAELVQRRSSKGASGLADSNGLLPLLRCNGKPILNASGEPSRMTLPPGLASCCPKSFVLEVGDDALSPIVITGDWVMVDPAADLVDGVVAVVEASRRYTLRCCALDGDVLALRPLRGRFTSWTMDTVNNGQVRLIGQALRLVNRELTRVLATSL